MAMLVYWRVPFMTAFFGEGTQKASQKTHQNREQRTCLFCVLSSMCFNVIFLFDINGINW